MFITDKNHGNLATQRPVRGQSSSVRKGQRKKNMGEGWR